MDIFQCYKPVCCRVRVGWVKKSCWTVQYRPVSWIVVLWLILVTRKLRAVTSQENLRGSRPKQKLPPPISPRSVRFWKFLSNFSFVRVLIILEALRNTDRREANIKNKINMIMILTNKMDKLESFFANFLSRQDWARQEWKWQKCVMGHRNRSCNDQKHVIRYFVVDSWDFAAYTTL